MMNNPSEARMTFRLCACFAAILLLCAAAFAEGDLLSNGSFDIGSPGAIPPHWVLNLHGCSAKASLTEAQDASNGRCLEMKVEQVREGSNAWVYQDVSFGFNPGALVTGRITEDERALGALTVGFGRQPIKFGGNVKGGEHHLDVIVKSPTLIAGGRTLLSANVFNPELGFVAL